MTPGGQLVPLEAVAEVLPFSSGPEQILHRERERAITVQVSPPPRMPLEEAQDRIQRMVIDPLIESGALEGGYQITLGGTADQLKATWDALWFNLVIAALITYLLMDALFESCFYPGVSIAAVPLGTIGGLLGLATPKAVGAPFGIYQPLDVLTMLGLLPLVMVPGAGSELYRGLGSVMLGGLVLSTFITLVLVPLLLGLCLSKPREVADVSQDAWDGIADADRGIPEPAASVGR